MNITGGDFVSVPNQDIVRAVVVYGGVRGLPELKRWGRMPAVEFQAGNLTLASMQTEAFGQEFRVSGSAIALQVDDVPKAREELEAKGVEFDTDLIDSGVCHQAYFSDPDGNPLGLHHRYG
jgi:hypothetical protein